MWKLHIQVRTQCCFDVYTMSLRLPGSGLDSNTKLSGASPYSNPLILCTDRPIGTLVYLFKSMAGVSSVVIKNNYYTDVVCKTVKP